MKISKILVPVDFSPCSRAALDAGVEMARRFEAELHVLHVMQTGPDVGHLMIHAPDMGHVSVYDYMLGQTKELFAEFLQSADPLTDFPHESRLVSGQPPEVIADEVTNNDIDRVVMGTNGRTGLSRLLLGSVAEKTVRRAPCAVMVVHGGD